MANTCSLQHDAQALKILSAVLGWVNVPSTVSRLCSPGSLVQYTMGHGSVPYSSPDDWYEVSNDATRTVAPPASKSKRKALEELKLGPVVHSTTRLCCTCICCRCRKRPSKDNMTWVGHVLEECVKTGLTPN